MLRELGSEIAATKTSAINKVSVRLPKNIELDHVLLSAHSRTGNTYRVFVREISKR